MEFYETPFSEYRYEDLQDSLYDYFVTPSSFGKLTNSMPTIIEGSRGSGKTTLLQSIEYNNNSDYLGVYFKANDNILTQFFGDQHTLNEWNRLFCCYFVLTLSYQLSKLALLLNQKDHIEYQAILRIAESFFHIEANCLEELERIIFVQKSRIIDYINNGAIGEMPFICNYAELIMELPKAIICSSDKYKSKTVYYLIDEFEVYSPIQQKCVLGFLKQHDRNHTFKIVTKPWGIAEYETLSGEQIQYIHDYTLIDLSKLPDANNEGGTSYKEFAAKICNKRIEKFLQKNGIVYQPEQHDIRCYFEEIPYEEELKYVLKKNNFEEHIEIYKSLSFRTDQKEFIESLKDAPIDFCVFSLCFSRRIPIGNIIELIQSRSNAYKTLVDNYRTAFLYVNINGNIEKLVNGFKDAVSISGGNIRYLLEFCHGLFGKLEIDMETYLPEKVSLQRQTEAVHNVSATDLNDIRYSRNVPNNDYLKENAGIKIREFIIAFGIIYQQIQRGDKLSVIEPNHFSIRVDDEFGTQEIRVLRECVMNGYFIAYENNKEKTRTQLTFDEYMYKLHPLFCSGFNISWRQKNKITIKASDLRKLFMGNKKDIERVIQQLTERYQNYSVASDNYQMNLFDMIDDNDADEIKDE